MDCTPLRVRAFPASADSPDREREGPSSAPRDRAPHAFGACKTAPDLSGRTGNATSAPGPCFDTKDFGPALKPAASEAWLQRDAVLSSSAASTKLSPALSLEKSRRAIAVPGRLHNPPAGVANSRWRIRQ